MIDGHGDDLFRYGGNVRINFSTNIPQCVDHSGLMDHLARKGAIFKNYPEPEPRSVEKRLAARHGTAADNIIVTNGATEAIYLLAHAYRNGRSAVVAPTFREYQDACRVFGHLIEFIQSLDGMGDGYDMVWLCNPNNPTGRVFDRKRLLTAIDERPATVFVVDQAYAAFSAKEVLSVSDVMARGNAVMLHSMTKQFVVPGLRIGYAIGQTEILDRMRALRMPWSVNSIAIEAAHYLLDNAADYVFDARSLHSEAERIGAELGRLGMKVSATDCNFLLARLVSGTSARLKSWLMEHHGLLIRDASNFEGLTGGHFRVAAQSKEENNILINALEEWTSLFQ